MRVIRAVAIALLVLLFFALAVPVAAMAGGGSLVANRLGQWFCRLLLCILGLRVNVLGRPDTDGARLVVANHVSWIDPLVLGAAEPLCPLAKQEVSRWPAVSTFARLQGAVFVDRSRRMAIPRVNGEMAGRLADGRSVLFFPEGTTFDGQQRGRFLTSHLACLAADTTVRRSPRPARVQPVSIAYSDPLAAWVGDATLLPHLWLMLGCRDLTCTLTYGDAFAPAPGFDRKQLGRQLAHDIELLLAGSPGPVQPSAQAAQATPSMAHG